MDNNESNIIIYNTIDGKASVVLYARDGSVWMNQNQLAELFDTSKQNIGQHISKILEENELDGFSVVKNYFITAADGKSSSVSGQPTLTFAALHLFKNIYKLCQSPTISRKSTNFTRQG